MFHHQLDASGLKLTTTNDTYAIVVFQHWTLKNKESRLPPTKVLSTFRQVTLFVSNLHDRLVGLPHDV